MNAMNTQAMSWWTNKRLFWFAFWTTLFAVASFFCEPQKEYDREAMYKVTKYRISRGGYNLLDSHIESGDSLVAKQKTSVLWFRCLGYFCLVAGVASSTIIVQRMRRGEKVFSEIFSE